MPHEAPPVETVAERELTLTRLIDVPPEKLYRCWTDPALLVQWFTLHSWKAVHAELEVRAGGASCVTMHGPDGAEMLNRDVYLEVVPNERLVLTDAFTTAWEPSLQPFMVVILAFAKEGGRTRYTVTVRHWSVADKETHEKMGFHEIWAAGADRIAALAKTL